MGKLPNVTAEQLNELDRTGGDLCMALHAVNSRIEKGYVDEITNPAELARSFLSLSRASADTAAHLLHKLAMSEMRADTERFLRKEGIIK